MQKLSLVAIVAASLLVAALAASAQKMVFPLPTPAMQPGIDKDILRHFGDAPADPGPLAMDISSALTPAAVDKVIRKVADWQLARANPYFDRIWTWSVLYSGFLAASDSTFDPRYREAMGKMADSFAYELSERLPNADAQSLGQTYLDLYLRSKKLPADAAMIAPTRTSLDSVIGLPTLKPGDPRIPWWWCDALFMAPPVWAGMDKATGDHKYINYLNVQWARTDALLYDKDEHLYARDESFIARRGPNGKKIFWSRGEGWVMGGLVRTLQFLPARDPRRPFYVQRLRELAARLGALQDENGEWHASLLDREHFPMAETSGAALIVYGMAWGVNNGLLDAAIFKPVIAKGWAGLLTHVYADGRLGAIQQTGSEPEFYLPSSSFTYGVGGFLLAGSEVKRMSEVPRSRGSRKLSR
jgi:unsaturated rhamnogalacturonyl hydrolase